MSQQINLFNPDFVPRRDLASAKYAAGGVGLAVVLAIAGSTALHWRQSRLATQEQALAVQRNIVRAESEKLTAQLGARLVDPALAKQLDATQALIASRQRMMKWFNAEHPGNTSGVSEYFRALARQTLSGVWLTGFHLGGNGKTLRIEGRTLRGDLVPAYLSKLGTEESLKGRAFAVVAMEEAAHASSENAPSLNYLTFKLETASPDSPAGAKP